MPILRPQLLRSAPLSRMIFVILTHDLDNRKVNLFTGYLKKSIIQILRLYTCIVQGSKIIFRFSLLLMNYKDSTKNFRKSILTQGWLTFMGKTPRLKLDRFLENLSKTKESVQNVGDNNMPIFTTFTIRASIKDDRGKFRQTYAWTR